MSQRQNQSEVVAATHAAQVAPLTMVAAAEIFARAALRLRGKPDANYAGAVTPEEAYQLWHSGLADIVDVRTHAEWKYVGHIPNVPLVQWTTYPDGQRNASFLDELAVAADPQRPILFLCRSAVRSHNAAVLAAQSGYASVFNILEGFEGQLDGQQQRRRLEGWLAAGLPWAQS